MLDRTQKVLDHLIREVTNHTNQKRSIQSSSEDLCDLFRAQLISRFLDYQARILKANDQSFYTIASAGHEANAVFGKVLQKTDPCLLHYRSGAMMVARARQHGYPNMVRDTLLSMMASTHDPTSGGRHKVWGNKELWVPPQTSTIASHLPKAVGMSFGIARAYRLGIETDVNEDSIVFVSFGDASCNHASAQTAFNAASWSAYQKLPTPVLFLCEDNGLGISVRTPAGWIEHMMSQKKGMKYFYADGSDLDDTLIQAKQAVDFCREKRMPVFFHLRTVRLFGHAGSDVETAYRDLDEIEMTEGKDPILQTARLLMDAELMSSQEVLKEIQTQKEVVFSTADSLQGQPRLDSATRVSESLKRQTPLAIKTHVQASKRSAFFHETLGFVPEQSPKQRHMAMLLNWALHDVMLRHPQSIVFGEDVARKGGVYHVTHGLNKAFGNSRVFNTLLDETMILGLGIGMAQVGFLPIPEIQYLAYYHNAQDQIRGEACSQSFFSQGQFVNPMVVRIASYAYQKGFGGHFHNDNSIAALLDVPGICIVTPSRGDDAARMLHHAAWRALSLGEVVMFLEPIALYMKKDLLEEGDGLWQCAYPEDIDAQQSIVPRVYDEKAKDLLIVTYGNGVPMSLQAKDMLDQEHGISVRVLDLRMLKPLDTQVLLKQMEDVSDVLIVDECRAWGGMSSHVLALAAQAFGGTKKRFHCVQAHDTYIPLGPAANVVLPQVSDIVRESLRILA